MTKSIIPFKFQGGMLVKKCWISLVQLQDIIEWHPKICWIDQACSDSTAVSILFLETYGEIQSPNPDVGGDNDVGLGLDAPLQSDVQLFQTPVTATCGVGASPVVQKVGIKSIQC